MVTRDSDPPDPPARERYAGAVGEATCYSRSRYCNLANMARFVRLSARVK